MTKSIRKAIMDDIDFDGLAERYWSAYDPAFQDDEEDIEEEDEDDDE